MYEKKIKTVNSSSKIDYHKFYPVRSGNDLRRLNAWIRWAEKNYKGQKFIIVDDKESLKNPLTKMRIKAGYDTKYVVYGSYN